VIVADDPYSFVSGEPFPSSGAGEPWRPDIASIGSFYPADYAGYMTREDDIRSCPALSEDGNVLFLALHNEDAGGYNEESDLIAFDVSNPTNVSEIGRFRTPYTIEQSGLADIIVRGDELFLSNNGGVSSIDVSNPTSMSHNWSERGAPFNFANFAITEGTLYGSNLSYFDMGWADLDNRESATYESQANYDFRVNEDDFGGISSDPRGASFIYAVVRSSADGSEGIYHTGISGGGGAITLYTGGGGEPDLVGWSPLTTLIQMRCSRFMAANPTAGSYATIRQQTDRNQTELCVYHTE